MKLIAQIEAFKARRPISQNPSSSASGEVSRIPSAKSACTRRNSFWGNLAGTWRGCQGSQEPSAIPSHKCEKSPWKIVHNFQSHQGRSAKKSVWQIVDRALWHASPAFFKCVFSSLLIYLWLDTSRAGTCFCECPVGGSTALGRKKKKNLVWSAWLQSTLTLPVHFFRLPVYI